MALLVVRIQWDDKKPVSEWKYWTPQSFIKNAVSVLSESVTYQVLYDKHGLALVEEKRIMRGLFTETFELYDYPFDKQVYSPNNSWIKAVC